VQELLGGKAHCSWLIARRKNKFTAEPQRTTRARSSWPIAHSWEKTERREGKGHHRSTEIFLFLLAGDAAKRKPARPFGQKDQGEPPS